MKLFCWIIDHSDNPFLVEIAKGETVADLKKAVLKEKPHTLAGVEPDRLSLWKVPMAGRDLKDQVSKLELSAGDTLWDTNLLSDEFSDPVEKGLYVLVQSPFIGIKRRRDTQEGVFDRLKRSKLATTAPSDTGKPSIYERLQRDSSERILDDRPQPDADIPPVPLLYDGFGHFLDIMDGRGDVPGLADIDVRELRNAVDDLATKMTAYFPHENNRRDTALPCLNRIFSARSVTKIPQLFPAAIGSVISDGHNIAVHGSGTMAVDFKNELAGISSLPPIELTGYVARLGTRMDERLYLGWRVPCLGLTIVGCDITFFAVVAVDHRLRVIALTPTLSCIASASDGRDRTCLYSAFTAASVLQAQIVEDTTRFLHNPLSVIPTVARRFPAVTRLRKYLPSNEYFSFEIQSFFPERIPNRLLYIAETPGPNKPLVVVKFARKYSIELHDCCAKLGHAPSILAFERLPGGWCAVAMRYVDSGVPIAQSPLLSTHRQRWKDQLQTLMNNFHGQDLVHGDLRVPNIVCEGESVLLLDFDWGGRVGEVRYPTWNLNDELLDGRVSQDLSITKDDDRRVLTNTLNQLG